MAYVKILMLVICLLSLAYSLYHKEKAGAAISALFIIAATLNVFKLPAVSTFILLGTVGTVIAGFSLRHAPGLLKTAVISLGLFATYEMVAKTDGMAL